MRKPNPAAKRQVARQQHKSGTKEKPVAKTSPEPVGPAADQCFKYVINNDAIEEDWTADLFTTDKCAHLSSGTVEAGSATFVVCCTKEDGKCKDCVGKVTLELKNEDGQIQLQKKVTITCRKS